jgi:hypothetical protein
MEQDLLLAEKDALHQCETLLAREKLLIKNERELAHLVAGYDSKITSLDVHLKSVSIKNSSNFYSWHHVVGKRPVTTCTNIVGFLPVSQYLYYTSVSSYSLFFRFLMYSWNPLLTNLLSLIIVVKMGFA